MRQDMSNTDIIKLQTCVLVGLGTGYCHLVWLKYFWLTTLHHFSLCLLIARKIHCNYFCNLPDQNKYFGDCPFNITKTQNVNALLIGIQPIDIVIVLPNFSHYYFAKFNIKIKFSENLPLKLIKTYCDKLVHFIQ